MGSCCGKDSSKPSENSSMDGDDGVPSMRHIENEILARTTTFSRSENINKSIECCLNNEIIKLKLFLILLQISKHLVILHAPYSKQDRGGNFCGTLAEVSEKENGLVIVGENNVVHVGLDAIGEE